MVKEHYVPRSYLRQFTPESEGLVSRYSLVEQHDGGDYHPPKDRYSINKAAAADGFADGWFENDETAQVENEMVEAIRKIINAKPLLSDDIGRLSQFIAFQHSRTPQSKLYFDARQRLGDLVQSKPNRVPDQFEDDWLDTLYYNTNEGHETLQYMGWRIIENKTDIPFITSDKPVVHYFEQDFEEVTSTDQDGNRSNLETMEDALAFGSGMKTMEDLLVYLEEYKPVINSRRLKSHAIWAFNHSLRTVEELRRDEPQDDYWNTLTEDG